MNATENAGNDFLPLSFYKKFETTSSTVFGAHGESLERRQARFIEKYLHVLVRLVMRRFKLDLDQAENIVLAFTAKLIENGALRRPAWGRFRYWMAKALFRFTVRRLRQERIHRRKFDAFKERVRSVAEDVGSFVLDDVCGFEERQIAKSLRTGAIEDGLRHGIATGELSERDVRIAMMELRDRMPHAAIARATGVDASTVSRTMPKIYAYFRRHAKSLRAILNSL